jgi:O-acetyl-ADP-ribose deacetylase (regulator of RNase III)
MTYLLTFLDYQNSFCQAIDSALKTLITPTEIRYKTVNDRLQEYTPVGKRVFFVSPANSYGTLDGGIDYFYGRMFPGLETKLINFIDRIEHKNNDDHAYLPIGSALILPIDTKQYFISAPTMWRPQQVTETQNAYWAFRAIMKVLDSFSIGSHDEIIIPGLCTGCGNLSCEESASQIRNAIEDHFNDVPINNILMERKYLFLAEPNKNEQPKFEENEGFHS